MLPAGLLVIGLTLWMPRSAAQTPSYGEHAADQHYDPSTMAAARASLRQMHGNSRHWMVLGERFEFDTDDQISWEAEGWYGGSINRFWLKTKGHTDRSVVEEAELQALYSRAIRPYWDLQFGVRHDLEPQPTRTHAVVALNGMAPFLFELDAALFLSDAGNLTGRLEAEYELRLNQRLYLQPRAEIDFAFSDDDAIGVGSGIGEIELGVRLRYEIRRNFAPYLGYQWSRKYGPTAEAADRSSASTAVVGIRFWF